MSAHDGALREAVVSVSRRIIALGLSQGTSGNVSVRAGDGFLVTPSGIPPEELAPEHIVAMDMEGRFDHPLAPSSEWRFHRDILAARPEAGAVVHAHPTYATAFAICGREIPAVHYMIAMAGGPTIRCAPYAPYGTQALSEAALAALEVDDALIVETLYRPNRGPRLIMGQAIKRGEQTLCKAELEAVIIDPSGRPKRPPKFMIEAWTPVLTGTSD